jgi:hypothetical protein
MEQLNRAQLSSALMVRGVSLQRSLSKEGSSTLIALMERLARRYPSQDLESSIAEFHQDYELLAVNHGLPLLQAALQSLRIKPSQKFFPRPDEVAGEIQNLLVAARESKEREEQDRRRNAEIEEFWQWAEGWMEATGYDEEELLRRWPSYSGTKPTALEAGRRAAA